MVYEVLLVLLQSSVDQSILHDRRSIIPVQFRKIEANFKAASSQTVDQYSASIRLRKDHPILLKDYRKFLNIKILFSLSVL